MASCPLGVFNAANESLHDFDVLDSQFREDGYLFFRQVLDVAQVLEVKRDFVRVLQQQGIVRAGTSEPIWTGAGLGAIDDNALYGLGSYVELIESQGMQQLMERVFGQPIFMFRGTNIRYSLPHDGLHMTPPHQDHFFIRANSEFRTVWVPLMEIGKDVGGLALAVGSHKRGLREHREQENVYSYQMRGRKQSGVALEHIGEPWLTTDYRAGDVLVFHSLMLHWALPNRSERVRLSLDARCQPKRTPRTWQAEKTIPELRRYRNDVKRIATEERASEELFEAVVIEMMRRGLDAERGPVQAVMDDLGGISRVK
ncbi:MAG TPA: phytanoyl-CoA dioxygenase family protein [Planctomycetaceae bacterium]|jgi:1-deoxypentalenic acid 11beta-hydroxylase|nr:phytanoyl-CoA dioxygenase family protein [Planctomycetaceae bacterium]